MGNRNLRTFITTLAALAGTLTALHAQGPNITNQPLAQTVWTGNNVTFSVGVSGSGPFTYQWQFNGTKVANSVISTVAGGGVGDGAPATNVNVWSPIGMALDSSGNLYIADSQNYRIRKVATNGIISTVAGNGSSLYSGDGGSATNAGFGRPYAVALDSAGNLYVADRQAYRVRKVGTNGIITTFAGNGTNAYSGDGGLATNASLGGPVDLHFDAAGNLLIVDSGNGCIRKVATNGIITTVAGTGTNGYGGDGGPATNAILGDPLGLAIDAAGNIIIADSDNQRVRKVNSSGIITTIAGIGTFTYSGDGGPATNAGLWSPAGLCVDKSGNLFIGDSGNQRIRRVDTNGIITTVAGTGTLGYNGDGGLATNAMLFNPNDVIVDSAGNLLISDTANSRIRKVNTGSIITTVAGNGTLSYCGDGGPALNAAMSNPYGLGFDSSGNLYVADSGNQRIRKVGTNGIITTVAGNGIYASSGDGAAATNASVQEPTAVVPDSQGNLYICENADAKIRKVSTNGIITTIAGTGTSGFSGDGGPATNAMMNFPNTIVFDPAGNIYVADSFNYRVRKISTNGVITTVAGNGTAAFAGDGAQATNASLNYFLAVMVDTATNLYIGDSNNRRVRKVSPSGIITTVIGNGGSVFSGDGGPAINATINRPTGLALDASNNLFISEDINARVRQVNSSNLIQTYAGKGVAAYAGDGGAATNASLNHPEALATDASGNLFIADEVNGRIRKVTTTQPGPSLLLNNVSSANAGSYRVIVTGSGGSVTSSVVKLTVANSPQFYQTARNANGGIALSAVSPPASTNVMSWTASLTPPVNWQPFSTNVAGGNGDWQTTDTNAPGHANRFYEFGILP